MANNESDAMRIRLLVVEDDPLMIETLARFMAPMCSFITSTGDLAEALALAKAGKFNLCLLDLRLETTGKEEAFHAIRELKSNAMSVIVISGIADAHLREDSMAAGADGFIEKGPDFNSDRLIMAANIAVLHLPKESFKDDSFSSNIALLRQTVQAP